MPLGGGCCLRARAARRAEGDGEDVLDRVGEDELEFVARLVWQLLESSKGSVTFEAEVIWVDEKIDTLSASQLDVLKRMLDQKYEGSAKERAF